MTAILGEGKIPPRKPETNSDIPDPFAMNKFLWGS
jgi:hypothetical protein